MLVLGTSWDMNTGLPGPQLLRRLNRAAVEYHRAKVSSTVPVYLMCSGGGASWEYVHSFLLNPPC